MAARGLRRRHLHPRADQPWSLHRAGRHDRFGHGPDLLLPRAAHERLRGCRGPPPRLPRRRRHQRRRGHGLRPRAGLLGLRRRGGPHGGLPCPGLRPARGVVRRHRARDHPGRRRRPPALAHRVHPRRGHRCRRRALRPAHLVEPRRDRARARGRVGARRRRLGLGRALTCCTSSWPGSSCRSAARRPAPSAPGSRTPSARPGRPRPSSRAGWSCSAATGCSWPSSSPRCSGRSA